MINFSTLQGLAIPEGVVTQIADASGRVLWKKAPATATITLNGKGNGWHHYVKHNSTIYYNATNTPSFQANIGDVIGCHCMLSGGEMSIYLNGILVAGKTGGTMAVDYSYTVVSDATIELAQSDEYRRIIITEVPEGQILFAINGTNYFADEGMTWAEWFASSHNTTGKTADDVSTITDSNGNVVNLTDIIVDGTAYEVGFAEMVTVTITGTGNANYCYVEIDGVDYSSAAALTIAIGTVITCIVAGRECDCGKDGGQNTIKINDKAYYTSPQYYTVDNNVTINLYYEGDECRDCDDKYRDCMITITEE